MAEYTGVLVAADASGPSKRAVERAANFAAAERRPLYLVHVIHGRRFPDALSRMVEVEQLVGTRSDVRHYVAARILSEARAAAYRQGVVDVEVITAEGDPATCIVEQADRAGVGLIVVGTRGLNAVAGALLGSVSHKVGKLAEQDVMVVR